VVEDGVPKRRPHRAGLAFGPAVALLILFVLGPACAPLGTGKPSGRSLVVGRSAWDFGTLERGESASEEIPLSNRGPDTLHVSLKPSCACVRADPEQITLPPGGSARVKVTYTGEEIKSRVTKTVFIDSHDPVDPRSVFTLTGTVRPGRAPYLVALPDPLALDPSSPSYPAAELEVTNRGMEVLRMTAVTCFGCTTTWTHLELAPGEEAMLEVTPVPGWTGRRWLEIESNDPLQPVKRISIVEF
jgi:hypothetical protein